MEPGLLARQHIEHRLRSSSTSLQAPVEEAPGFTCPPSSSPCWRLPKGKWASYQCCCLSFWKAGTSAPRAHLCKAHTKVIVPGERLRGTTESGHRRVGRGTEKEGLWKVSQDSLCLLKQTAEQGVWEDGEEIFFLKRVRAIWIWKCIWYNFSCTPQKLHCKKFSAETWRNRLKDSMTAFSLSRRFSSGDRIS